MKKRGGEFPTPEESRRDDTPVADAEVFAREMRDVVRLQPDSRGRVRDLPRISPPRDAPPDIERVDRPDDAFVADGVDRREIRKLRQGRYIVRDRRDLHGMTAAEAVGSVERFIKNSRHSGYRCVCVVHGRGLHSDGGVPTLKARVREYLRSHRSVLAFADAPASDGGTGAVYVLLRK